ncbi:MAG: hypothetical protein ACT4OM_01010 [Actinomycetota bacterium]
MGRDFFDQVDDEVRGLVGPELRSFATQKGSYLLKLWYADPATHFEVQLLSGRWAPRPGKCVEVGLHLESKEARQNQELVDLIMQRRDTWEPYLPAAEHGKAIGPNARSWRRLSEIMYSETLEADFAGEVAERLAGYIVALHPLLPNGRNGPRPETCLPQLRFENSELRR